MNDEQKSAIEEMEWTKSEGKKFTAERNMTKSIARNKPEMVNALFRDAAKEVALAVFAECNRHEVALVFSSGMITKDGVPTLVLEAIVRPVLEAVEFPYDFDKGEPENA